MRSQEQSPAFTLKLLFILALAASFLLAFYTRFYAGLLTVRDTPSWPAYLAYLVVSILVWSVLETRFPLAPLLDHSSLGRWFGRLLQLDVLTLALVSIGTFFWRDYSFSRYVVAAFWLGHLLIVFPLGVVLRAGRSRHRVPDPAEVWLATDDIGEKDLHEYGRKTRRHLTVERLSSPTEILERLRGGHSRRRQRDVLIALGAGQLHFLPEILKKLDNVEFCDGILLPANKLGPIRQKGSLLAVPTRKDRTESLDYIVSKRVLDLFLAAAALILLAPLMLLISAVILGTSGRPVLLSQQRVGRRRRLFRLYKFRTLAPEALERSEREWTVRPSSRLTAFLRFTGLDELPQLINVIRGDMSLVGPRPERPYFVERFENELPFYSTRHRLHVGITGWAQINGWRGDTSIARRVEYDLYYLNHWSLALDLRILVATMGGFVRSVWNFGRLGAQARHAGIV